MPLLVLFLVALSVSTLVAWVAWHYPAGIASPTPSVAAARAVGREIGHHSRLRRFIKSRLNPEVATGLALTVALGAVIVGGLFIGALAYLVGRTHGSSTSTRASLSGVRITQGPCRSAD